LKEVRTSAEKRQKDMAEIAGITRSAYAFWETWNAEERTLPNADQITAICKAFGVSADWLLGLTSEQEARQRGNESPEGRTVVVVRPARHRSRTLARFWADVADAVIDVDPTREAAFDVELSNGLLEVRLDYGSKSLLAALIDGETNVVESLGKLVATRQVMRFDEAQMLLLVHGVRDVAALRALCRQLTSVEVIAVETPLEAAKGILSIPA